jgi:hypothetical protein
MYAISEDQFLKKSLLPVFSYWHIVTVLYNIHAALNKNKKPAKLAF